MMTQHYYIMVGKRYLRFAHQWLKRGGAHLTMARRPLPDCELTMDEALRIAEKMLKHRGVSAEDKASISLRRIEIQDFKIPLFTK